MTENNKLVPNAQSQWYGVLGGAYQPATSAGLGGGQGIVTTTNSPWGYVPVQPSPQPTARNAADRMVSRMEKAEAVRSAEAQARIGRFRTLCERYAAEKLSELFAEKPHDPLSAEEESELKALAAACLLTEGPADQDAELYGGVAYGPAMVKAY